MNAPVDVAGLIRLAAAAGAGAPGSARAVARLISLVEADHPQLPELMAGLVARACQTGVVGITGAPGVGKSTTTSALVGELRRRGQRVGVLAVDPSSPFSGGALLGDRVRMQEHALDDGVFIRSMATRGHLGGLARACGQAVRVLAVAGYDMVLIETVGVGQSEVEVAALADTCVVLLAPGMGDGVQAAKAGVLEIGDIFVVNKADRDGVDVTVRDLNQMIALGPAREPGQWRPSVLAAVASRGEGIGALVEALDRHREWSRRSGRERHRRRERVAVEIESIAIGAVRAKIPGLPRAQRPQELAGRVLAGELDPYAAAEQVLAGLTAERPTAEPSTGEPVTTDRPVRP